MTDYKVKVIELERSIYTSDYYVNLWEQVKDGRDITGLSDVELCEMLNDFWYILPDSKAIHRAPFYVLCDLCEGIDDLDIDPTRLDVILSSGTHTIEFTKKNGEYRKMQATRDINIIRQHLPDCEDLEPVQLSDTSIVVFDLEKKDWRRFMVENLIDIN